MSEASQVRIPFEIRHDAECPRLSTLSVRAGLEHLAQAGGFKLDLIDKGHTYRIPTTDEGRVCPQERWWPARQEANPTRLTVVQTNQPLLYAYDSLPDGVGEEMIGDRMWSQLDGTAIQNRGVLLINMGRLSRMGRVKVTAHEGAHMLNIRRDLPDGHCPDPACLMSVVGDEHGSLEDFCGDCTEDLREQAPKVAKTLAINMGIQAMRTSRQVLTPSYELIPA
jgi:hypothetical protein